MKRCDVSRRALVRGWVACSVLALAGAGGPLMAQARVGQYAQADIQYGSRIYAAQCTVCHGASGETVAGVDLRSGQFRRVVSDNDLRNLITTGIPGTAMPAFKFDASELAMIVAYVRNMRDFDAGAATVGEPGHGQVVYEGAGNCTSCHRINGRGPRVAPDLSDIGAVRGAHALQQALLEPNASIQPVNRSVRAVTRDGTIVSGRRLNEDTYTVQLIDEKERLVSLDKSGLREYTVIMASSMPSYKDKLSSQDLADVVAYLLSLKGLK